MRTDSVRKPMYMMGAAVIPHGECDDYRDVMRTLWPRPGKLHWRNQNDHERGLSMKAIADLPLPHVAVVSTPLDRRQERARAKTLEALSWELQGIGVKSLSLERRTPSQAVLDRQIVAGLRGRKVIDPNFKIDFAPGVQEPLLWIADQVLGAIGEAAVGNHQWLDMIERNIRYVRIKLS